MLDIFLKGN